MGEVRSEFRVTEGYVERVGVVRDRHQLAGRGLGRTAAVEEPGVGIVAELPPEHHAGREVPAEIVVLHRLPAVVERIIAGGAVVCPGRHSRETDLGAGFFLLVHHVHTYLLIVRDILYLVGVYVGLGIQHVIPGILFGSGTAPGIAVICLDVEIVA